MSRSAFCLFSALAMVQLAGPALAQGIAYLLSGQCGELKTIDLQSGLITPVGTIGREIHAIAFVPDGRLFGVDIANDELVEIDPVTGQGSTHVSLDIDLTGVSGLTFDELGRLWMIATTSSEWPLYEVDPATGQTTEVGTPTFNGTPMSDGPHGLAAAGDTFLVAAFNSVLRLDLGSMELSNLSPAIGTPTGDYMDFDAEGSVWVAHNPLGIIDPPRPPTLSGFDRSTGNLVAVHVEDLYCGLAITAPQLGVLPVADVPALSAVGTFLLAGLLLVFGGWKLRSPGRLRPPRQS